jgi:predicted ATPase
MDTVIRTPDQRLRVFVSSTLGELAQERQAARAAIEGLHLAPVMFELGARPHPPRELYRAYLEQSHVFVGIYWQRYGWVAPEEEISGLEDEYRLAGERPRLLYIKEPAPEREERLNQLLADLRNDDRASYRRFSTAEELKDLLFNDLALLLSERFEAASTAGQRSSSSRALPPVPLTATLGRSDEVADIVDRLDAGARIVTLTGPGGIGKTRVAVEVANGLHHDNGMRVLFVPLAAVGDATLVLPTIADRLELHVEGPRPPIETLAEELGRQPTVLVLDNLEQVIAVAPEIAGLLERAPQLRVVATSRQALRIGGEQEVPLSPLSVPDPHQPLARLADQPAVRLFVERAQAVSPQFALTEANAAVIAELCRRLDGLPLAIELAAARTRLLPPAALLERLGERLDLLAGGSSDLPERQKTLRSTIDWSYELLDDAERALFARLSIFAGGWSLSAAESICGFGGAGPRLLETMGSLLDKSLLSVSSTSGEAEPRFEMLETIRAYALDHLSERDELDLLRRRHLEWYARLADEAQPFLCGPGQKTWAARFDPERANLRAAVDTALSLDEHATVIELVWDVIVFYYIRDAIEEPESWMARVAAADPALDEVTRAKLDSLQTLVRIGRGDYTDAGRLLRGALAVFESHDMSFEAAVTWKEIANVWYFADNDVDGTIEALETSSRLFAVVGHDWGVALSETMLGTVLAVGGNLERGEAHHRIALEHARRIDNEPLMAQALHQLAIIRLFAGSRLEACDLVDEAAQLLRRGRYQAHAAQCLDAVAAIAFDEGDPRTAARALAGAEATRRRLGVAVWPTVRPFIDELLERALGELPADELEALAAECAERDVFELLDEVVSTVRTGAVSSTDRPVSSRTVLAE